MFSVMFISSRSLGGKMWNISSLSVLIKSRINIRLSVKKLVTLLRGAISAQGKDLLVELLS
jgi:hypothetical protein